MTPVTNTFITPSVIASLGLATLYNNFVMAPLVWQDFNSDFNGSVGDTVNIRKPVVFEATEFDRSSGIDIQDATEDKVPLTLDTIADVSFEVTAEELTLDIDSFATRLLQPAMMAIVQKVDSDLANAIAGAALGAGGGGTVTMDKTASDAIVKAREVLTRNKLPLTERYGVFSPEGTSVALADEHFIQAQMAGTTQGLRDATVGRAYGIDTYETGTLGYGPGDAGSSDGLVFHRSAVVMASRPLSAPLGVAPNMYSVNNFRNLSLRVVQQYDLTHKLDVISVDFLYGLKATRPQGAVVVDMGKGS